jgi:hypothetical protein
VGRPCCVARFFLRTLFFRSLYIYTYNFSGYMTVVRNRWGQTFLDVATDFSAHGLGSALRRGRSPCQLIRWTSARSRTAWWRRLSVDSQGLPRRTPNKTAAIHLSHLLPSVCGVFSLRHSRASVSTFPVIGPIDTTVLVVNLTTALRLVPSVLRVARPQQPCDCARRVGR